MNSNNELCFDGFPLNSLYEGKHNHIYGETPFTVSDIGTGNPALVWVSGYNYGYLFGFVIPRYNLTPFSTMLAQQDYSLSAETTVDGYYKIIVNDNGVHAPAHVWIL